MSRFGAVGDALTGFGKAMGAVNPQAIKITSSMPDLGNLAKGFGKMDGLGDAAKGLNKVDDVGGAAKGLGKTDDVGDAADDAQGVLDWMKKNPGKAVAGAGASAAAVYAATKYSQNNGKKVSITKIEAATEGGVFGLGATDIAKITFTPEMDALLSDTLKIEGTDCVPKIDGTGVNIYKVYSSTVIGIKVDSKITTPGTKGNLTLSTSLAARAGEAVGSAAGAAGEAAGGATTSFLQGLGIPIPDDVGMWLGIACLILCCLFIVFKFLV